MRTAEVIMWASAVGLELIMAYLLLIAKELDE
jgi:hypothetical protein